MGSPAIADQVIHPGAHGSDGTSIWLTWTPEVRLPGSEDLPALPPPVGDAITPEIVR